MVDVTLPSRFFLGGYEDFMDPPSVQGAPSRHGELSRRSLLDDLMYYWSLETPQLFDPQNPSLLALCFYPLRIVGAEWVNYIAIMHRSIKHYEYSNSAHGNFILELEKLNSDMRALQSWRRRSMSSQHKLRSAVRLLRKGHASDPQSECCNSLLEDYDQLMYNMIENDRRLENMLPVVASLVQIVDTRRSFAETANVGRLTVLAFFFLPLSFVSSLFSMTTVNGPGGSKFWVYFAVAIPFTILVYLIARPPMDSLRLLLSQLQCRTNPESSRGTKELSPKISQVSEV